MSAPPVPPMCQQRLRSRHARAAGKLASWNWSPTPADRPLLGPPGQTSGGLGLSLTHTWAVPCLIDSRRAGFSGLPAQGSSAASEQAQGPSSTQKVGVAPKSRLDARKQESAF